MNTDKWKWYIRGENEAYHFYLVASNGQTVLKSPPYQRPHKAMKALKRVQAKAANATIIDTTVEGYVDPYAL